MILTEEIINKDQEGSLPPQEMGEIYTGYHEFLPAYDRALAISHPNAKIIPTQRIVAPSYVAKAITLFRLIPSLSFYRLMPYDIYVPVSDTPDMWNYIYFVKSNHDNIVNVVTDLDYYTLVCTMTSMVNEYGQRKSYLPFGNGVCDAGGSIKQVMCSPVRLTDEQVETLNSLKKMVDFPKVGANTKTPKMLTEALVRDLDKDLAASPLLANLKKPMATATESFLERYFKTGDSGAKSEAGLIKIPLLMGLSGIAKSAVVKRVADKLGYRFLDFRAAFKDKTDFAGQISVGTDENGQAVQIAAPPAEILDLTDETMENAKVMLARIEDYINDKNITEADKKVALTSKEYFEELKKPAILFIDEITRAPQDVQGALLQLFSSKKYVVQGGKSYSMTKLRVVAATNFPVGISKEEDTNIEEGRESRYEIAQKIFHTHDAQDAAFNDRFLTIALTPEAMMESFFNYIKEPQGKRTFQNQQSYDDWKAADPVEREKYSFIRDDSGKITVITDTSPNFHPLVIEYLTNQAPTDTYVWNPKTLDDAKSKPYATFRTWEFVSGLFKNWERLPATNPKRKTYDPTIIKKTIGDDVGGRFVAWLDTYATVKRGSGGRDPRTAGWSLWESEKTIDPKEDRMRSCLEAGIPYMMAGPTGTAKCLAPGTKVVMYDGSMEAVEDIKIGDTLMGDDGTPRVVLSTSSGMDNMYAIKQNKGIEYVTNSVHILTLKYTQNIPHMGRGYTKKDKKSGTVVDIELPEFMGLSKTQKHLLKGFKVGVNFAEKSVLIDPYFLGLWLGDGTSAKTEIWCGDTEVETFVRNYANQLGMKITEQDGRGCRGLRVSPVVSGGGREYNPLKNLFKHYGLVENKHIPSDYKCNSRAVRLQVLAGLIDTDGTLDRANTYVIVQKSSVLANDIVFLARSLGFYVSMSEMTGTIKSTGFSGKYYRLFISGNLDEIPVKIARKKANPRKQKKDHLITGFSVEPRGFGKYYGFTLTGNGRFLLEDFTVTHNTARVYSVAQELGYDVYEIRLSDKNRQDISGLQITAEQLNELQVKVRKMIGIQEERTFASIDEAKQYQQMMQGKGLTTNLSAMGKLGFTVQVDHPILSKLTKDFRQVSGNAKATVFAKFADLMATIKAHVEAQKPLVLFFDEMNRTDKEVLSAVFEVISDNRFGGIKFPPGLVKVVAAANVNYDNAQTPVIDAQGRPVVNPDGSHPTPEEAKIKYGQTEALDPAVIARFVMDVSPDVDVTDARAFKRYALGAIGKGSAGFHPAIVNWLQTMSDEELVYYLRQWAIRVMENPVPTMRSLEDMSKKLYEMANHPVVSGVTLAVTSTEETVFPSRIDAENYISTTPQLDVVLFCCKDEEDIVRVEQKRNVITNLIYWTPPMYGYKAMALAVVADYMTKDILPRASGGGVEGYVLSPLFNVDTVIKSITKGIDYTYFPYDGMTLDYSGESSYKETLMAQIQGVLNQNWSTEGNQPKNTFDEAISGKDGTYDFGNLTLTKKGSKFIFNYKKGAETETMRMTRQLVKGMPFAAVPKDRLINANDAITDVAYYYTANQDQVGKETVFVGQKTSDMMVQTAKEQGLKISNPFEFLLFTKSTLDEIDTEVVKSTDLTDDSPDYYYMVLRQVAAVGDLLQALGLSVPSELLMNFPEWAIDKIDEENLNFLLQNHGIRPFALKSLSVEKKREIMKSFQNTAQNLRWAGEDLASEQGKIPLRQLLTQLIDFLCSVPIHVKMTDTVELASDSDGKIKVQVVRPTDAVVSGLLPKIYEVVNRIKAAEKESIKQKQLEVGKFVGDAATAEIMKSLKTVMPTTGLRDVLNQGLKPGSNGEDLAKGAMTTIFRSLQNTLNINSSVIVQPTYADYVESQGRGVKTKWQKVLLRYTEGKDDPDLIPVTGSMDINHMTLNQFLQQAWDALPIITPSQAEDILSFGIRWLQEMSGPGFKFSTIEQLIGTICEPDKTPFNKFLMRASQNPGFTDRFMTTINKGLPDTEQIDYLKQGGLTAEEIEQDESTGASLSAMGITNSTLFAKG